MMSKATFLRGRPARSALSTAAVCVLLAATAGEAADATITEADWSEAVAAVSKVATDPSFDAARRSAAILAVARMQIARGKGPEALKACWAVFDNPGDRAVATAAVQAASLVIRQQRMDLAARAKLLAEWSAKARGAASKQAASIAIQDLSRSRGYLAGVASRRPVPAAIRPAMPHWGRPGGSGPKALAVKSPVVRTPPYIGPKPRATSPLSIRLPVAAAPVWSRPGGRDRRPSALRLTPPVYIAPQWHKTLRFTKLPVYIAPRWHKTLRFTKLKDVKAK